MVVVQQRQMRVRSRGVCAQSRPKNPWHSMGHQANNPNLGFKKTNSYKNTGCQTEKKTLMDTMLIFVLIILEQGEPRLELAFRELTSCLEYKTALVHQDVSKHAIVMPKTRHFDAFCEPRLVPVSDVGTKLLLRDPTKTKEN